jgi:predicted enzyme related to lactoylglutathione lyase
MANVAGRGRFCWFNLAAADTAAAIRFYARIFGWKTREKGGVTMWESPAGTVGSIGPLPEALSSGAWLPYVAVPDVQASVARAEQLGASVTLPATSTGMGGFFAHLQDPQGAAFGLYAPADVAYTPPAAGQFSWVELMTSDAPAAATFYFELLGWKETSSLDMGATGKYQMFGIDGIPYGGIYNPGQMPMGPQWVSYVRVPDVAAATAAAKAAGGRVINGPIEVPGGDWIVQLLDPQGALIAAHELASKAVAKPQPAARPRAAAKPAVAPTAVQAKKKPAAKKPAAKKKAAAAKRAPVRRKTAVKPKARKKVAKKKTLRKVGRLLRLARKMLLRKKPTPTPRKAAPRKKAARRTARRKK